MNKLFALLNKKVAGTKISKHRASKRGFAHQHNLSKGQKRAAGKLNK